MNRRIGDYYKIVTFAHSRHRYNDAPRSKVQLHSRHFILLAYFANEYHYDALRQTFDNNNGVVTKNILALIDTDIAPRNRNGILFVNKKDSNCKLKRELIIKSAFKSRRLRSR